MEIRAPFLAFRSGLRSADGFEWCWRAVLIPLLSPDRLQNESRGLGCPPHRAAANELQLFARTHTAGSSAVANKLCFGLAKTVDGADPADLLQDTSGPSLVFWTWKPEVQSLQMLPAPDRKDRSRRQPVHRLFQRLSLLWSRGIRELFSEIKDDRMACGRAKQNKPEQKKSCSKGV